LTPSLTEFTETGNAAKPFARKILPAGYLEGKARPAVVSPTPRNFPHPQPLQNSSSVAKYDNNTSNTFGYLRAYTLPEFKIRKGTL